MEEDRQPAVARYRAQLIATPLDIYERLIFSTTTKALDSGKIFGDDFQMNFYVFDRQQDCKWVDILGTWRQLLRERKSNGDIR